MEKLEADEFVLKAPVTSGCRHVVGSNRQVCVHRIRGPGIAG